MAYAYTQDDLDSYLAHINYPRSKHASDPLQRLTEIVKLHACKVSFNSFALHYSQSKLLSLEPEAIFNKIVVQGRGGYCMEQNALLAGMMRTLGYNVLTVGGRVRIPAGYTGWSHMINIVTIDGARYMVDAGFGSHGPMRPIPLQDGYTFAQIAGLPRRAKLEFRNLAEHSDPSQRVWVYSTQENQEAAWEERHMFTETEFFPLDFEGMNLTTMTHRASFFVQNVLSTRAVLNEETGEVVAIYTLLGGKLRKHAGGAGEDELVAELKTEQERVEAIREYFGVELTPLDIRGIRGMPTELKGALTGVL